MSTEELLQVDPLELKFPFELKKQISCTIQLSNKSENHVAFKVKTTNPMKYCVRPNTGLLLPRSSCDVTVTMQAQKDAPYDMQCKDKFKLQSVVATSGITPKDITSTMFAKEGGQKVEECKLKVVYVSPPQPTSPLPEGSDEVMMPMNLSWKKRSLKAFFDKIDISLEPSSPAKICKECGNLYFRETSKFVEQKGLGFDMELSPI